MGKSESAFKTISEVAEILGVQQHVLRFWETKFSQIKPLKRSGGRRYYRPEDIELLKRIYNLLYVESYTIKGVQKLLKGQTRNTFLASETGSEGAIVEQPITANSNPNATQRVQALSQMLNDLRDIRAAITDAKKAA